MGRREVWIIPIVHSLADMGSLATQIAAARNEDATSLIDDFWDQMLQMVLHLELDFKRVRLYQDSLPECGREEQIVEDVARQGSVNFRLLRMLMRRGARLEGTESAELLVEELRLVRSGVTGKAERLRELGQARDKYIAAKISASLEPGEVGLVFLGMMHNVVPFLPSDIGVRYPFTITE